MERATLTASLEKALKVAEKEHQNQSSGQYDLFSLLEEAATQQDYVLSSPWSEAQRLEGEREVLGLYLTGHPADAYRREFKDFIVPISQLNPSAHKKATICGQVAALRKIVTKRGKRLVILGLDDATSRMDVVVFGEVFDAFSEPLTSGDLLLVEGEVAHDDFNGGVKMTANQLHSVTMARANFSRCLELHLNSEQQSIVPSLQALLKAHPGTCVLQFVYSNPMARVQLSAALEWKVNPTDELLELLRNLLSVDKVVMRY